MKKQTYVGVFLVTLATLMYEILLTRIFSVTMWYHFAFMAVSLAMFGMTVGALWVYWHPQDYAADRPERQMAFSSLLFGIFAVVSFLTHWSTPFIPDTSMLGILSMGVTYVVMSVPFLFSGICVCLALTRYPREVSKLYAADLAGAASGCVLLIYTLKLTDGPTAVVVVGCLACTAAALFAAGGNSRKLRQAAILFGLLFAIFAVFNTVLVHKQSSLLRLRWTKGETEPRPLFEKWNSFSRIAVTGDMSRPQSPLTEGISSIYPADHRVRELYLTIDAGAETTLTAFDGKFEQVEHLKYDVKNFAHYFRPNSDLLVVGAGGGRDILAALAFGQKSVRAVEINEDILNALTGRFGRFTGHLDRNPRVTFVNDEARSYITRLKERFDIIQVSFVDTWAATAAGALTLSEDSLYTVEAWNLFLERLTPHGVLSFSRWYFPGLPAEAYRLTSLASAALKRRGVANPREHIVLVRNLPGESSRRALAGAGTILVSKEPLSAKELDLIEEVARRMRFEIVLSPRFALDPTYSTLASGRDPEGFVERIPFNLSPPTDDRPFFFNLLRFRDIWRAGPWIGVVAGFNASRVYLPGALLIIVISLTLLVVVVPLILTSRREILNGAAPHFLFFAAIGLGFMLIEVSQMQRLIIFLGHPTYALSVVLFVLLVSSGLGSFLTRRVGDLAAPGSGTRRLLLLLVVLIFFGILTPRTIDAFRSSTTPLRIGVAGGMLFPLGVFMGMAFPLGFKLTSRESPDLTPWLWGINGATSTCASVLAFAIALSAGISAAFWTGVCCYGVAAGSFAWAGFRALRHPRSYPPGPA